MEKYKTTATKKKFCIKNITSFLLILNQLPNWFLHPFQSLIQSIHLFIWFVHLLNWSIEMGLGIGESLQDH